MLRVQHWSWVVLCCLAVPILIVYCPPLQFQGPTIREASPIVDNPGTVNIADTTPHDPINITSNQDFISQGWPGNGSQTNPYRLENLSISGNETCIRISDTDVFFIVTGCVVSVVDVYEVSPPVSSVHFSNVTNGILMNSVVSSPSYAVLFESSRYCSISDCQIDAESWCVHFQNCSACVLSQSVISGSRSGVYLEDTSDVRVLSNVVVGGYYHGYGILVSGSSGFEVSNNEVCSTNRFDHDGISVYDSSSGAVTNNTVYQNRDGIALSDMTYCDVINNSVYDNYVGIFIYSNGDYCTIESNSIHHNDCGLWAWGDNNTISRNSFQANEGGHADDSGNGNVWLQNWWDDYIGYGWYPVEGIAGSYDTDPEPKNTALLVATTGSILLIVLGGFLVALYITRRVRRAAPIEQSMADWDTRERFSLPLVVSMLLSFGVHLYLPAFNPARWSVWTATPLGVLSWTGQPSWGHQAVEFVFPVTEDVQLLFFYVLFGFLWFILNAVVVRRFWLFTGGEIDKKTMKRTIQIVLIVMLAMSLATLTIPLPVTPLATLLQVSRFKDTDSSSETVTQERTEPKAIHL